jgi:hypothetical protein
VIRQSRVFAPVCVSGADHRRRLKCKKTLGQPPVLALFLAFLANSLKSLHNKNANKRKKMLLFLFHSGIL